jgi:hypothetical protein
MSWSHGRRGEGQRQTVVNTFNAVRITPPIRAQVASALCSLHNAHSRVPDAIMEAASYIYGGLLIVGGLMGGLKVRAPLRSLMPARPRRQQRVRGAGTVILSRHSKFVEHSFTVI